MLRLVTLLISTVLILTLLACTAPSKKYSYRSLKCPSCGHTFDAPVDK